MTAAVAILQVAAPAVVGAILTETLVVAMEEAVVTDSVQHNGQYLTTIPFQSAWLTADNLTGLKKAVRVGETGHSGEIRVVIERSLPFMNAWRQTARERAYEIFAHFRVWDTQNRSGVLIYLNLAEHRLEIVADSGIDGVVGAEKWQQLADEAVKKLYEQQYVEALERLIFNVAELLRRYYGYPNDRAGNELEDAIVVI
ncbi:hypothetical protein E5E99_05420 [Dichelobacter nodosus]|nr:hypothetical protein DYQ38_05860 [Dichelobacter nodosus]TGA64558.1 hypothetical protein E5E99_05420 [Dichelobacter nodosus]